MRILAIRGANLASLADPFAVELADAPLADAGIFAITGPTGAGKSTILDALCLALFDRTPRLTDQGGVKIGVEGEDERRRLSSNDARTILTKGASSGFAEVDFVGTDGVTYRARWSVRRARTGTLADQELSLKRLADDQAIGGKKREVLDAIRERVGLDFEQFRRSALLAQGEFAAFLRAGADERAALLEKMTGTEIYQRISQLAYERGKREREVLERMEGSVQQLAVSTDDGRRALEEGRATVDGEVEAAKARAEAARAMSSFFAQRGTIARELAAARATLAAAEGELASRASLRAEIEAFRAVLPMRALRDAAETTARDEAAATEAEATAATEAAAAEAALSEAAGAEALAREALARATEAYDRAGPAVAAAAELDDAVLAATTELGVRVRARAQAEQLAFEAARRLAEVDEKIAKATAEHDEAVARLAKGEGWRRLATEWARFEAPLARYVGAWRERAGIALDALVAKADAARAKAVEAARVEAAAQGSLDRTSEEARAAEGALGAVDRAGLRAARGALEARRRVRLDADAARAAARKAAEAIEAARREEADALATIERAAAEEIALTTQRTLVDAQLETATASLELAVRAADLEVQRAELREGAPCPLCGSCDHPYRAGTQAPLSAALRAQVEALREGRDRLVAAHTARASTRQAAQAQRPAIAARLRGAEEDLSTAHARWGAARASLPELAALREPTEEAVDALRSLAAALEDEARALEIREHDAERIERAATAAREARERALGARDAERAKATRARDEADEIARGLEQARGQAAGCERTMTDAVAEVAPAFDGQEGWEAEVAQRPEVFVRKQRKIADAWLDLDRARAKAESDLAALRQDRLGAATTGDDRARALDEARALEAASTAGLAERRAARAALLDGEETALYERRLREARERARQALDVARDGTAARREATSSWAARREAAEAQARKARARRAAADRELSDAVVASGRTLDEILALLTRDEAWLSRSERALDESTRAAEGARAVVAEGEARLARHDAQPAPTLAEGEVEGARAAAEQAHEAAVHRRAELAGQLQRDDAARAERSERAGQLEAQRASAERWSRLAELVGSADGKKLRVFAQSLTFEALLEQANFHLHELARRYSLARVPGSDLDLQIVDHDLGDDARPTTSLSGGESFLVSLALALGLSSLGSQRTRVETLFIDEGFGTLDREALDLAIGTLEALQSSGRQVGIISHVNGLAERLGARVELERKSPGRSTVRVLRD